MGFFGKNKFQLDNLDDCSNKNSMISISSDGLGKKKENLYKITYNIEELTIGIHAEYENITPRINNIGKYECSHYNDYGIIKLKSN